MTLQAVASSLALKADGLGAQARIQAALEAQNVLGLAFCDVIDVAKCHSWPHGCRKSKVDLERKCSRTPERSYVGVPWKSEIHTSTKIRRYDLSMP